MKEHEHQWVMRVHVDGCHFFSTTFACDCGARLETFDEREPERARLWMVKDCPRCNELLAGDETIHIQDVIEAA